MIKNRELFTTSIARGNKAKLEQIARTYKLMDHGRFSKGRAIDFLINNYFVVKAGSESNGNSDVS